MIYDHKEYKCYSLLSGFRGEHKGEKHGKIKLWSSSWIDICVIISLPTVFKTGAFRQQKHRIHLCHNNIPLLNGVMEHFKKSPVVPQPPCAVYKSATLRRTLCGRACLLRAARTAVRASPLPVRM